MCVGVFMYYDFSSHVIRIINCSNNFPVISAATRSKQCACGCSPAVMAGSNPAGAWISVTYKCCVLFSYRPLRRADQSSRGVLPSAHVSLSVIRFIIYSLHPHCLCRRSQTEYLITLFKKKTLCLWISNSTFLFPSQTFWEIPKVIFRIIKLF